MRECREELGITIAVGDALTEVTHVYPDLTVHLTLYCARIAEGEPQLLEHKDLRWITPGEIDSCDFCPADEALLKEIKERGKYIERLTGYETLGREAPCQPCRVSRHRQQK